MISKRRGQMVVSAAILMTNWQEAISRSRNARSKILPSTISMGKPAKTWVEDPGKICALTEKP